MEALRLVCSLERLSLSHPWFNGKELEFSKEKPEGDYQHWFEKDRRIQTAVGNRYIKIAAIALSLR